MIFGHNTVCCLVWSGMKNKKSRPDRKLYFLKKIRLDLDRRPESKLNTKIPI